MASLETQLEGLINLCQKTIKKANTNNAKKLASILYEKEVIQSKRMEDLGIILLTNNGGYSVTFDDNTEKKIMFKESWECGLREGIGQELYNIISGNTIKYICNRHVFLSDYIEGVHPYDYKIRGRKLGKTYSYNYGVAEEMALFLRLGDRHHSNILLTEDDDIVHVDFGCLFQGPHYSFEGIFNDVAPPRHKKTQREGREDGKVRIFKNVAKNIDQVKRIFHFLSPNNTKELHRLSHKKQGMRMILRPHDHIVQYASWAGWIKDGENLFEKIEHSK